MDELAPEDADAAGDAGGCCGADIAVGVTTGRDDEVVGEEVATTTDVWPEVVIVLVSSAAVATTAFANVVSVAAFEAIMIGF